MITRATFFLLGVCVGAALPVIIRAARPVGAYALAGGMIAYEAACDALEASEDVLRASAGKVRHGMGIDKGSSFE